VSRVSDNSSTASIKFALNKTKERLEDLQLKGSTLKKATRPSDDPVGNVESLAIGSRVSDNAQYLKNADYATLHLSVAEKSLEEITDLLVKAKEIAITQSSDLYDENTRKAVANEVIQLRNMAMSIANKRVGQKYVFGGFKSLTKPFDDNGVYQGDKGRSTLEIAKDFFVPINLHGAEIFYANGTASFKQPEPINDVNNFQKSDASDTANDPEPNLIQGSTRTPASKKGGAEDGFNDSSNIFTHLDGLIVGLENNDATAIQGLLEKFDDDVDRLVTLRTRIGSVVNSIDRSKNILEADNVSAADRKSKLVDADIAELFSDISRHQNVLQTSYKASQAMLNQSLIDFLR
tara:strand:+ start:23643 stop:24686 length:1044 start_codon:yes stop_codon:yes gene_type:complete